MATVKIIDKTIITDKTIFLGSSSQEYSVQDATAASYITSVESADGASLETSVKQAIDTFVLGCKSDGIWNSISTCCLLAGPRTLNGALIPLIGTAPTNVNFSSGDYSRLKLTGGTSKYLNSNVLDNTFGQNNFHMAIWQAQAIPSGTRTSIGVQDSSPYSTTSLIHSGTNFFPRARNSSSTLPSLFSGGQAIGLFGVSRNSSSAYFEKRPGNSAASVSVNSITPLSLPFYVFSSNNNGSALTSYNGALSFYSIGQAINLDQLNARVTALMSAIASGI